MDEYIEKPDMQYILHIKSDKKVEKRLIDYCIKSVIDVFEDTGLTADVQLVKRGQWKSPVSVGNGIKFCSVCRNEAYWDTDYGQQLFNYCPYCGARMDGEENV